MKDRLFDFDDETLTEEELEVLKEFEQMLNSGTETSEETDDHEEEHSGNRLVKYNEGDNLNIYCLCLQPSLVKGMVGNETYDYCRTCKKERL